jgi:anaphase-promoting complex subunit 2
MSEEDVNLKEDLGKQYVKSNIYSGSITSSAINIETYDNLSSDEDEAAAENWEPLKKNLPISNIRNQHNPIISSKSKFSDIISTLVNIFGSPEKFIEQYKRMLAERSVSASENNFQLENEIKNLELLKLKFGESLLQGCDILIKDVKDSIKLNNAIKNKMTASVDGVLNTLIINKNYWPFADTNKYEISTEELGAGNNLTSAFENFMKKTDNKFKEYVKHYNGIKFSRTLNYFTNMGYVDLVLSFENGDFNFRVTPLSALVIKFFEEDAKNLSYYKSMTLDFISEKLKASSVDVKKKLNFWVNKGVLLEKSKIDLTSESGGMTNNSNLNDYGEEIYYQPVNVLKSSDNSSSNNNDVGMGENKLIIEEDTNIFEYSNTEENKLNIENAISSIIKNAGQRNFEQLYKNLYMSYQITISEIKLNEILGKMILEQKIFKEGEVYKLIIPSN